jgi:gluconolactonase
VYAAPPETTTETFTVLPDALRRDGHSSEWRDGQPGPQPPHSLLEGPSFDRDGNLWCVDIAFGRVFRVSPAGDWHVVADYHGEPNGLKIHRDGRIFVADYRNGIVTVDPETGRVTPVLERVRLERLKAVNDLVFDSSGNLYFTDQGLTGWHDPTGRVFRLRPDGRVDCLIDNVPSPNGLVLNLDEDVLYVAVTRANAVWRLPFLSDGSVAKVGTFIQMSGGGGPDGLALDEAGNLAVAHIGIGSIWLFSAQGEPIRRIRSSAGRHTTNMAYGGAGRRDLYITESETGTILKARLDTPGRLMFSHM